MIAKLKEMLAAAKPGRLSVDSFTPDEIGGCGDEPRYFILDGMESLQIQSGETEGWYFTEAGAQLFAAAVNALPALLAVAEAAQVLCPIVERDTDAWRALREALHALEVKQ